MRRLIAWWARVIEGFRVLTGTPSPEARVWYAAMDRPVEPDIMHHVAGWNAADIAEQVSEDARFKPVTAEDAWWI